MLAFTSNLPQKNLFPLPKNAFLEKQEKWEMYKRVKEMMTNKSIREEG